MKITVSEETNSVTLNIEGRIAGPWVQELVSTWKTLENSLSGRSLIVNLSGVTFMEAEAKECLRTMRERAGAVFTGSTPLTSYFAEEFMKPRKAKNETKKGIH